MDAPYETLLKRWQSAGLIDQPTADRIRRHESQAPRGLRWPILVALGLGGLLLGAGILLFVAAHWERMSPASRMALIIFVLAALHTGGAVTAQRFTGLSTTLHAVGTVALGGAVFMSGQIFNMQEHWPAGVLLWMAGAWAGWWLLRDWPHTVFVALLSPAWIFSELSVRFSGHQGTVSVFLFLTALTYVSTEYRRVRSSWRKALVWIGAVALIPCALWVMIEGRFVQDRFVQDPFVAMGVFLLPLAAAFWIRGPRAWKNGVGAMWTVVLLVMIREKSELPVVAWCAIGSLCLIAWGLDEARAERINLGVVCFALTVLVFYFSHLMDALGRAFSMIVLGVVFLVGGWYLEQLRRILVLRAKGRPA